MIEKITVKNYQSLYDVEVELGKFTVLYGNSDVGKSAFYRAVRGLLVGESGDDFITVAKSRVGVSFKTSDGVEVVWLKSRGKSSSYILFKDSVKVKEWRRARKLPKELEVLLQVRPINVDGESFYPNLRGQFDPLFLLFESAGKRARVLGSLVSNLLLKGIRAANTERNRNEADIRAIGSLAEDLEKKMGVDWQSLAYKAEKLGSYGDSLNQRYEALLQLQARRGEYRVVSDEEESLAGVIKDVKDAEKLADSYLKTYRQTEELFPVLKKYKVLEKLQAFSVPPFPPIDIDRLSRIESKLEKIKPLYALMKVLGRDIFLAGKELDRVRDEVGELEVEIRKVKAVATVTCPHCGKEFIHGTE